MSITVMFWNVWYENQIDISRMSILEEALEDFISEYKPDVIGLNEVVQNTIKKSVALDLIMNNFGYKYFHHSQTNRINKEFSIGSAIYSKTKIIESSSFELGSNNSTRMKGHNDHSVLASTGTIKISGKSVGIIVAHPVNIKPTTLKNHYQHTKNLKAAIKNMDQKIPLVIGGDMNEPRLLPFSVRLKLRSDFHHKSGTFRNPSWRYNGRPKTILRANLDKIFWSKNKKIELSSFTIIDTNVSDHRPLIAKFEIDY